MSFQDYLKNNQKLVYDTFVNSLNENRLSHAYLITGNEGAPLLETSLYLAKSLICENRNPLACEKCLTCLRFEDGNYADFKLLNGQENNIKVSDIESLQSFFQNTPSEKSGKMIYIIHALENSNRESLNALLKFLEEPEDNILGFFITTNKERVIDTIKSRCQIMKIDYATKSVVDEKIIEYANEYVRRILENCDLIVNKEFILPSFGTRNEINSLLTVIFDMYMSAISEKYFPGNKKNDILSGISLEQLKKQIAIIEKTITLNQANVSLELLLDQFVIEMRRVNA